VHQRGEPAATTYADIEAAAARIEGIAHRTPALTSSSLDSALGASAVFKCENFQRAGAFKFRGAYNAIASLSDAERAKGVVAYSSGNHAQAMALASRLLGTAATIIMPTDAPKVKVEGTKRYGGEVVTYDRYTENREEIGQRLAAERGLSLIPPYDDPRIIAGQGTATKELIEQAGPFDRLFVPLGGGGLLAGAALAARALSPGCKVIGVEPEAGDDGRRSFRAGHVIHMPAPRTIADGAATTHLGAANFPIIQALVEDIVTVSDAMLVDAMRFFAERMKIIVEPTGCLGAAALLSGAFHQPGERVGVLVSGGNVDLDRFAALVGTAA
jgi:threonine dehydratase